jgi:hypothetical protein
LDLVKLRTVDETVTVAPNILKSDPKFIAIIKVASLYIESNIILVINIFPTSNNARLLDQLIVGVLTLIIVLIILYPPVPFADPP